MPRLLSARCTEGTRECGPGSPIASPALRSSSSARARSGHRWSGSPNAYDEVIATYKTPIVNSWRWVWSAQSCSTPSRDPDHPGRLLVRRGPCLQADADGAIMAIWLVLMIPGAYFMLIHTVENLFGSTS